MKPFPTLSYSPESINHSKFSKPGKAVFLVGFPPKYLLHIILVPIASLSCVAVIKAVISILKSVFILFFFFFFLTVFMSKMEMEMATHSSILAWKSQGHRSLVGRSPWCCKESDMTWQLNNSKIPYMLVWRKSDFV